MDEAETTFKPPYNIPWATLLNTIDRMGREGVPNRVDRTYLSNVAGGIQSYLITALKGFELIGPNGEATRLLSRLAENPEERPAIVADLLTTYYPQAVALGQSNATQGELDDAFKESGYEGATRRKAVTFFLHAARFAKLPLSPLWTAPKVGTTSTRSTKPRKAIRKGAKPKGNPIVTIDGSGEHKTITIAGAGTITISVNIRWLDLPDATFTKLRQIIRDLEALDSPAPPDNQDQDQEIDEVQDEADES